MSASKHWNKGSRLLRARSWGSSTFPKGKTKTVCKKTHEWVWNQYNCFWGNMSPYTIGLDVSCLDKGLVFVRISIWGRWCEMVGNFAFASFVETEQKWPDWLFLFSVQVTGFQWWETLTGPSSGYRSCPPCGFYRSSNTIWCFFSSNKKRNGGCRQGGDQTSPTERPS